MAAIARILAQRVLGFDTETDVLQTLTLVACAGLVASFLVMSCGVDLSPGFF
jgi:hypothetical protein